MGLGLLNTGYVDESVPGCEGNQVQPVPRLCTYGIPIKEVSCGLEHSAFVTWGDKKRGGYVYTIGSNSYGQLGVGDNLVESRNSPVLVEALAE